MSFISDYRTYSKGNEAPATYHLFASLVALSSIVSRKVWIDMGYYTLYPNLYVVLVGPPGAKKSTAIGIAKGLLYALKTIPFSGECTSKEKLVLDMVANERTIEGLPSEFADKRTYSPITVMASELSEFFSLSGEGMVGFLTDVFDINFPYEHKTKNKGSVVINGPYLSILAGTTPSWITTYLRSDVIGGGFTRRCLFVYEPERGARIWKPEITHEQREAWAQVYCAAERLKDIKGPFFFEPAADAFCQNWYESMKVHPDSNLVGYHETKHVQMIKLAMLVALSEREEKLIRIDDVHKALSFLELIEANLHRVYEGMGRNEMQAVAAKIMDMLRRAPLLTTTGVDGVKRDDRLLPKKKLQQIIYPDLPTNIPDALEKVLEQLKQTDKLEEVTFDDNGVRRTYIRLKEK